MKLPKTLGLIVLIFTFGEAALGKLLGGGVPDWFLKQFTGSPLDQGLFSLKLAFWMIALLEATTALTLCLSVLRPRFERAGLLLAQLTFFSLMIGERLTHNYSEAFQLFAYSFIVYFFSRAASFDEGQTRVH